MEHITDADYAHAKRVCKDDSDTLLLADAFENFSNVCLKIYELDHAKFLLAPG